MAQALYDEHPLDDYLRESGDLPDRVPGAFTDSSDEEPKAEDIVVESGSQWKRSSVVIAAETIQKWVSPIRGLLPTPNHDFAERFKYDLISSNLLSTSVATTPLVSHSRTRSQSPNPSIPGELRMPKQDVAEKSKQELKSLSSAFVFVGLAALLNQYRIAAALAMFTSLTVAKSTESNSANKNYIPQMFDALKNLKDAGSFWDSVVNDTITTLEQEERSSLPSSSSGTPPSPSSALRIALHSTLLTTQNQCDNVRPLLAALASPSELSQLAEMYAPSSPSKPCFSLQTRTTPRHGRVSVSENAIASLFSTPDTPVSEKRRTWNGANTPFDDISARTPSILGKRDRRRSDMFTLLEARKTPPHSTNAPEPATPRSPPLTQVLEVDEDEEAPIDGLDASQDNFGTAALFLRRRRRSRAINSLGLSSKSTPALRNLHLSPSPPSLSSSRFTSMQSSRHPLSMSALHHALQGALSARRYASAHLLALRFDEDAEDEVYWENVRSVIDLLTSTLEDGAARLIEALEEADRMKSQESQPSPSLSPCPTPSVETTGLSFSILTDNVDHSSLPTSRLRLNLNVSPKDQIPLSPLGTISFAPVPTALGRFASHLDALSSTIDDAREHMEECLSMLREQELNESPLGEHADDVTDEQAIVRSYEHLRRELGLALRECERGKAALSDVFEARRRRRRSSVEQEAEEGVRRERCSGSAESSDKNDVEPHTPNDGSPVLPSLPSLDNILAEHYQTSTSRPDTDFDDVTEHLLASSSSAHLPPPGIEQVFEAEVVENERFTRERSKLSREERIKLMKSKRASMGLSPVDNSSEAVARRARMGWGPGPEVVEELKDVIWKVGEQRRKMVANVAPSGSPTSSVLPSMESTSTTVVPPFSRSGSHELES